MLILILLSNLLIPAFLILPIWNLKNTSKELLGSNTDTYSYQITHRSMYNLVAKLTKNITRWGNGTITHENKLCIDSEECKTVQFEQIESFYKLSESRKILCPIGKYDPINLINMEEISNSITKSNKWDLKCYNHNTGFFFVFYFMNGRNQVYDLQANNTYSYYETFQFHQEIPLSLYISNK